MFAAPSAPRQDVTLGATFSPRFASSLGLDPQLVYTRMLDELKVRRVRLPLYWDEVEPQQGTFAFAGADYYLREARRRGVRVIPVVGYKVPRWPECFPPDWARPDDVASTRAAILRLVQAEVDHFRTFDNVSMWQVENEPFVPFGQCAHFGVLQPDFVRQEVALVRRLDPRPILITDSGEESIWLPAARLGDDFGCTLYRSLWFDGFGRFSYPLSPRMYGWRDGLLRRVLGVPGETIVAELQAEAWFIPRGSLLDVPPSAQVAAFPPSTLLENVRYARQTGFSAIYLWGVEWWYWMEAQGHPEYLFTASTLVADASEAVR
jgi:hypothetical protein